MSLRNKRVLVHLNFPKKMQGGFTLIELLVVISIVSLLSSVVLAALNGARTKADDTQRNQIVGEYVKALALAYDAAGTGSYPDTGNNTTMYCLWDYPTLGNYTSGTCRYGLVGTTKNENATVLEGPTGITGVKQFLPSLPTLKIVIESATRAYQGPFYQCTSATGCSTAQIEWYLQQTNQKCIKGATYTPYSWGTKCVLP